MKSSHRGIWICSAVCLLMLAALLSPNLSKAQSETRRYFPQSGHYVSGAFLEKYNNASDPLKLYGYPITEEFQAPIGSPVAGLHVQYFQRARFEYHPAEGDAVQSVKLAPLGKILYELDNPGAPLLVLPENHPACRYFPETGNQVCYAFLNFFESNGGEGQFGLPVSNIVSINGRLVQYFDNTRFEWRPELPSGQRVALANTGQIIFSLYEDPIYLMPVPDSIPNTILDLQVHAFPLLAVMPSTGTQVFYVIVQDQQYRPVQGAQVILEMKDANGNIIKRSLPGTNSDGITHIEISLQNQPLGLTEVLVNANLNSRFEKQIRTSYRVWW